METKANVLNKCQKSAENAGICAIFLRVVLLIFFRYCIQDLPCCLKLITSY